MSSVALLILAGALFAIALGLLVAELLVPSHGILAAFCGLAAIAGVVVAYYAHPTVGLVAAIVGIAASPFIFSYAVKLYPHTPFGRRVILNQPTATNQPLDQTAQTLEQLMGLEGTALTPLRPSGACEIDGRRIDCLAESTVIDPGTRIQVVRVSGLKVFVRPLHT